MSPRPPARNACSGLTRVGAYTIPSYTTGDAMILLSGLLSGLKPLPRQSSLPVAGSCPVTQSPPFTTISTWFPYFSTAGVAYESGDSRIALVGRSIRQTVLPRSEEHTSELQSQ